MASTTKSTRVDGREIGVAVIRGSYGQKSGATENMLSLNWKGNSAKTPLYWYSGKTVAYIYIYTHPSRLFPFILESHRLFILLRQHD